MLHIFAAADTFSRRFLRRARLMLPIFIFTPALR